MDWRFTPEQEAFRREVRAFLQRELPSDWQGFPESDDYTPDGIAWSRSLTKKLVANGWLTMAWPKRYGGQERTVIEQMVFKEEMALEQVPISALGGAGPAWVGPALMVSGTEEQKSQHLPRIAQGEYWCTGYSEPNTGSDLSSLETRAVCDGDDYIVNGTKIWTSSAHLAGWCWLAVRTNPDAPKHKGISMLLVDMKSPGVTVRPILEMSGHHLFNQVFFENVRVPVANRVGEENRGWYVLAMALDFERSGIANAAANLRKLRDIERSLADAPSTMPSALLRNRFADLAIEAQVGRNLAYRVGWMQAKGLVPNMETSIAKTFITETSKRIADFGMAALGLHGQPEPGSPRAAFGGRLERAYLTARAATIGGGTSEVQRNIIATRGLGLPR